MFLSFFSVLLLFFPPVIFCCVSALLDVPRQNCGRGASNWPTRNYIPTADSQPTWTLTICIAKRLQMHEEVFFFGQSVSIKELICKKTKNKLRTSWRFSFSSLHFCRLLIIEILLRYCGSTSKFRRNAIAIVFFFLHYGIAIHLKKWTSIYFAIKFHTQSAIRWNSIPSLNTHMKRLIQNNLAN